MAEGVVVGVGRHRDEGHDRDRGAQVGGAVGPVRLRPAGAGRVEAKDAQRFVHVLDEAQAEVVNRCVHAVCHVLSHLGRCHGLPRLRQRSQARREVDAVAIHLVRERHHIGHMNADAKPERRRLRLAVIEAQQAGVQRLRRKHSLRRRAELHQQAVTGGAYQPAFVLSGDGGVDKECERMPAFDDAGFGVVKQPDRLDQVREQHGTTPPRQRVDDAGANLGPTVGPTRRFNRLQRRPPSKDPPALCVSV